MNRQGEAVFSRLLFPTDCSAKADSLVAFLSGLVPKPQRVHAVTVVPIRGMEQPLIKSQLEAAQRDLEGLVRPLTEAGIEASVEVLTGRPAEAIFRVAKAEDCSAIVLGSFGKSPLEEILKGSLSGELTRAATLPVLYVRFGILAGRTLGECAGWGRALWERILHPTDFSDCSRRALDLLLQQFADQVGVVDLVHIVDDVFESDETAREVLQEATRQMDDYCAKLEAAGIAARVQVVEGDPAADVLRLAGELGSTCLVLGSHGKGLVREAMVGSVSQSILRLANKPVLVVR